MSVSEVSLTSSARANLLSLKSTAKLLSTTENRLATGYKVNSALDNASAYFQSTGFVNRANDLSNLKDSMATSLSTVTAASNTIESITSVITQMQGLLTSALQTSDTATRAAYATQYDALRTQIDYFVSDSTFNGTNLLNATANLTVYFNEDNTSALTVSGVNVTAAGLEVSTAASSFASSTNIQAAQSELSTALTTLRSKASSFGNNTTVITTRQDFTNNLINALQTASDNLTLADTNEESANLSALQTKNQLAVISLGISNTSEQAILRLF